MAGLTVTEKEHWKARIGVSIDRKIESLAAQQPTLLDSVKREAHRQALRSCGLADWQAELDQIDAQREQLDRRQRRIQRTMLAHLRSVPIEDVDEHTGYQVHHEVTQAVGRRQAVHEEELLAESELGREILRLRAEKENLLDTVWLATSPAQVKQLWSKVAALLGDVPTPLEQEALSIAPVEES